jgi:hypothetical protein
MFILVDEANFGVAKLGMHIDVHGSAVRHDRQLNRLQPMQASALQMAAQDATSWICADVRYHGCVINPRAFMGQDPALALWPSAAFPPCYCYRRHLKRRRWQSALFLTDTRLF